MNLSPPRSPERTFSVTGMDRALELAARNQEGCSCPSSEIRETVLSELSELSEDKKALMNAMAMQSMFKRIEESVEK